MNRGRTRTCMDGDTASRGIPERALNVFRCGTLFEGQGKSVQVCCAETNALRPFIFNEEFITDASHQRALSTFLLFAHSACRFNRFDG